MADNTYKYYDFIDGTGIIVPDTDKVRAGVEALFKEVFGNGLDVSPETPQGRLIEIFTLERMDAVRLNAQVANQINPDVATGNFLDAIGALTDSQRAAAVKSRVEARLTGAPGAYIPAGALARTAAGDDFYLENGVSLSLTGQGLGVFLSSQAGPVPAPAGSLNTIVNGVLGWETVTNDAPAVLGSHTHSDRDFRIMRRRTLFTGANYLGAMESALWRVPNVRGVLVLDNPTGETVTKDLVTLKPHSVYACVYGGKNEDIALALYKTKTVGAGYNGDVAVTVKDPLNGRDYQVYFQRPYVVNVKVEITIEANSPAGNITQAVLNAIAKYQAGEIANVQGLNIGVDVSPFELAAAIVSQISGVLVRNVRVAKTANELQTANIEIHASEIARIPAASVVVNLV